MSVQLRPSNVEEWYKASTGRPVDVAQKAYEEAVDFFKRELTNDEAKKQWASQQYSLDDVLDLARDAEVQFKSQKGRFDKAHAWAVKLSKRLLHYAPVFDMLSQQHPAYTALGWGALKFVLMGTIEHANQFSKISEAISAIGDVLPRSKLYAELYPTSMMMEALYRLYAHILLFLMKATRWFNYSRPRQAIHAILHPFDLTYDETVEQIRKCTQYLDTLASTAAKAEQRQIATSQDLQSRYLEDISIKLVEIYTEFQTMQTSIKAKDSKIDDILKVAMANRALNEEIKADTGDSRRRIVDLQGARIRDELKSVSDPQRQLLRCVAIAQRRQSWKYALLESETIVRIITQWASSPSSLLLILQAGPRAEAKAKDLAIDVINLIQATGRNLIWVLSTISDPGKARSATAVFQTLVSQILERVPKAAFDMANRWDISDLHRHLDETWWQTVFVELASKIGHGFVIVDAEELFRQCGYNPNWITDFLLIFQRLVDLSTKSGNLLKILVINYSSSSLTISALPATQNRLISRIRHTMPPPPRLRQGQGRNGSSILRRSGLSQKLSPGSQRRGYR